VKSLKLTSFLVAGCLLLGMTGTAYADRYIVLYKKHGLPKNVDAVVTQSGGKIAARIPQLGIAIVESDAADFETVMAAAPGVQSVGIDPAFTLPAYAADTVKAATPVTDVPDSPAWFFDTGELWGIERVKAPEAWEAGVTGSHDTVVAVIDTGIAWNHPDLASNVVHVACYTSEGSQMDFVTDGPCNPYPTLDDHGTHVAGTVAANFGGGVVGVGPNLGLAGYNTFEVIPGCGVCSFSSSRWLAQLDAAERGFQVINMSLGSLGFYGGRGTDGLATFVAADARIQQAVTKAGVTVVAAGGNSGLDLNGVAINIPGGLPAVVNVGATGIQPAPRYAPDVSYDVQAFYSNQGAAITVAAPGGDCGQIGTCDANRPADWFEYLVLSSIVDPDPTCGATASCPVGWGWKAGTSMASPHAAGVVGLIRDENPGLSASQAATLLKRTAENLGDRQQFGHGMVDARAAIGK
jgi:subtilisin family serine protease